VTLGSISMRSFRIGETGPSGRGKEGAR